MAISQLRSRRKPSGGRYHDARKKKLHELGSSPWLTKVGVTKRKALRICGGNTKHIILTAGVVNVFDPATQKRFTAKIETVTDNPANRNFIRRNIINRGAIVKTDKGLAKITNRPSQEGTVNAVLIKA